MSSSSFSARSSPILKRSVISSGGVTVSATEGTSYLVHAFEEDTSFPAGLNGRFHGIVTDRTRGVTTLFNDRFGMHRVYYHQSKEAFYFAAEAKAILAVRPEVRRPDARGLGEFVACGCVLENRTLFDGVRVMPSSSAWVFRHGALENKHSYFHPREWEQQTILEPEPYYRQLREVFSQKLPRYFGGTEPVGMSLTGGLDSRMIMAWHKAASGSLSCYSFRGTFRDCQDSILARQVAGGVPSAASGHLGRERVSVALPSLRGAHGLSVGRMRRGDSVRRSLRERAGRAKSLPSG